MNPILPPKLESTETHTWHRALASNWWELRPVLCERAPGIVNTLFCLLLQRALLLFYSQSDYIFLLGRCLKGQKEAGENCILLIDNCVSIHFCPLFKVIYVCFWVWWCVITNLNKRKKKCKPRTKLNHRRIQMEAHNRQSCALRRKCGGQKSYSFVSLSPMWH